MFKPATRQGIKPLIAFYAESGCGKTYSALLAARGMVGPHGKIGLADSESGRGSLYADMIPGGYSTMEISSPFSPSAYCKVIDEAESAGLDLLIIDSGSHEWEGIGGVLDMAGDNEQRSGKPGLHNWKTPKLEHNKFVLRLLQSRLPIIICLRAKYKSRQVKNERGKTEIVKDDNVTPIQAEDFIFEMTAHAEILPDHSVNLTKCSHPNLRACFPKQGPIKIEHGELIAQWANGSAPKAQSTMATVDPEVAELKRRILERAAPHFSIPKKCAAQSEGFQKLQDVIRDKGLLAGEESLSTANVEQLRAICGWVENAYDSEF